MGGYVQNRGKEGGRVGGRMGGKEGGKKGGKETDRQTETSQEYCAQQGYSSETVFHRQQKLAPTTGQSLGQK